MPSRRARHDHAAGWSAAASGSGTVALGTAGCALLGVHVGVVFVAVLGATLAALAVPAAAWAVRHARLTRQLERVSRPGTLAGAPIRTLPGAGPMVAGLLRPRVFCGEEVAPRLTHAEQRAVLLHERSHQRHRDPMRLVALEAIERTLGGMPWLRWRLAEASARLEIRADADAIAHGASRPALASALLRLADLGDASAVGFATVTDQRIAALLLTAPSPPRRCWPVVLAVVAASAAMVVVCLGVLSVHHGASAHTTACLVRACVAGA